MPNFNQNLKKKITVFKILNLKNQQISKFVKNTFEKPFWLHFFSCEIIIKKIPSKLTAGLNRVSAAVNNQTINIQNCIKQKK